MQTETVNAAETLTVQKDGEGYNLIITHNASGSRDGITLSESVYKQLERYFRSSANILEEKPNLYELIHDTNTPLIMIEEFAKRISQGSGDPKQIENIRHYNNRIRKAIDTYFLKTKAIFKS